MSADYFLKVFHALMVLGPWCFGYMLVITAIWLWRRDRKKKFENRVRYDEGLVIWTTKETHGGVSQVAIHLEKLKWTFVGSASIAPYSVKVGSVVRIKYLLPESSDLVLQVEMLDVVDLDSKVVGMETDLLSLSQTVRRIRGSVLPEGTRDELS